MRNSVSLVTPAGARRNNSCAYYNITLANMQEGISLHFHILCMIGLFKGYIWAKNESSKHVHSYLGVI